MDPNDICQKILKDYFHSNTHGKLEEKFPYSIMIFQKFENNHFSKFKKKCIHKLEVGR